MTEADYYNRMESAVSGVVKAHMPGTELDGWASFGDRGGWMFSRPDGEAVFVALAVVERQGLLQGVRSQLPQNKSTNSQK